MLIPYSFFGTLKEVKANCSKIITRLRKGSTLESLMKNEKLVDSNDYPDSFYWVGKAWSMAGASKHFIFCELGYSILKDRRLSLSEKNSIIDDSVRYLSTTPWGTLIINGSQNYEWASRLPLLQGNYRKEGFISILKGFMNFYEEYKSEGKRFFGGGSSPIYLYQTLLLVLYVVGNCHLKYKSRLGELLPKRRSDLYDEVLKMIIDEKITDKLERGELPKI